MRCRNIHCRFHDKKLKDPCLALDDIVNTDQCHPYFRLGININKVYCIDCVFYRGLDICHSEYKVVDTPIQQEKEFYNTDCSIKNNDNHCDQFRPRKKRPLPKNIHGYNI